jgi:16S rRNA (guanine966-N2)-methyltransferase
MGDRVRSALFNMVDVKGKTVLDAFAGTGALGLEALSRGASFATFIERNRTAVHVIDVNITTLNLAAKSKLIQTSVARWLTTNDAVNAPKFDIIFADPPYHDPQFSTATDLTRYLNPEGLMVLSYQRGESAPTVTGVVVVDNRRYGEAALAFYRKG